MTTAPQPLPGDGPAPYLPIPVQVRLLRMRGSLLGATDTETGRVYVRSDATAAEAGAAILAGVREVADAWLPEQRLDGADDAPVRQLHEVEPRRAEEDTRGLG